MEDNVVSQKDCKPLTLPECCERNNVTIDDVFDAGKTPRGILELEELQKSGRKLV